MQEMQGVAMQGVAMHGVAMPGIDAERWRVPDRSMLRCNGFAVERPTLRQSRAMMRGERKGS